ncbi:MAG: hypothetical protein HUU46_16390 [Candidatus Hydrogenedentes bacterium]|nr:hypothetical protein [Candidatus Hydrogenedentota bacterium]
MAAQPERHDELRVDPYRRRTLRHPLATNNGWLDDKGIARLSNVDRSAVLYLFDASKTRRQHLKWLTGPAPVFDESAASR